MPAGSFIAELQRRHVLRAGALYIGAVWALAQGIAQLGPTFGLPESLTRWFVIAAMIGLPFWLVFAWFYEWTPQGFQLEREAASTESVAPMTERKFDFAIFGVLAIVVILLLTDRFVPRGDAGKSAPAAIALPPTIAPGEAPATPSAPLAIPKSIAVLPLVNEGGAADQQYFSDGLTENLITALSQFEGLVVIGRNSSFQFRDTKDDSKTIGGKLGVATLLEGSVRHAGDVVRVNAELIHAVDGHTLWSQRYDRPYKDLFALQDEITQAVADALHAKLLSPAAATKPDDRPPSGNLDAYSAYLQGLAYWQDEDFPRAAEFMAKAVRLDADYAMAWAHLSGSWSTAAMFWDDDPALAREHMNTARVAADKALQLAPGLGAAHAAHAYLLGDAFDHEGALAECRRAVQLAPKDGTVLNGCGYVLAQIGKLGEAIQLRKELLSTEPLYLVNYLQYAQLLMAAGQQDEADKYLRTAESLPHTNPHLQSVGAFLHLTAALLRGNADAAMNIALQMPAHNRDLYTTLAAQIGPDRAAADAALASVLADPAKANVHAYLIAQTWALREDPEQTVAWLERAPAGDILLNLLTDPLILRWRDDPRLIAFCEKIGLPPPSESEALGVDRIRAANRAAGTSR